MHKALFSSCGKYRYTLWRDWRGLFADEGEAGFRYANFVCLNPSTATDTKDDNTIRKCTKFAKNWGYDGLAITNIFAYRSTDPSVLPGLADPIGPENDKYILDVASGAALVVAAWSQHAGLHGRSMHVRQLLKLSYRPVYYLKMGAGPKAEPHHPLYLRDTVKPIVWEGL